MFQNVKVMVIGNDKTSVGCYGTIYKLIVIRVLSYQFKTIEGSDKLNKLTIDYRFDDSFSCVIVCQTL